MPNNITNVLEFSGNQNDIDKLFTIISGIYEDSKLMPIDFNKIIPMPDYIYTGNLGIDEQQKYGSNNWYDWSIANWETKWNAYSQTKTKNAIEFDTAWGSPTPIFHKLVEIIKESKFNICFQLTFADENRGCNTGYYNYTDGNSEYGHYEDESNEAYSAYVKCKGESNCLHKGDNGSWMEYDCCNCPNKCDYC